MFVASFLLLLATVDCAPVANVPPSSNVTINVTKDAADPSYNRTRQCSESSSSSCRTKSFLINFEAMPDFDWIIAPVAVDIRRCGGCCVRDVNDSVETATTVTPLSPPSLPSVMTTHTILTEIWNSVLEKRGDRPLRARARCIPVEYESLKVLMLEKRHERYRVVYRTLPQAQVKSCQCNEN